MLLLVPVAGVFTGHGRTEGTIEQATDERMLGELRAAYENLQRLHEVDERRIGLNGSGSRSPPSMTTPAGSR